ncbi:hypothetical protein GCM10007916_00740 [Psychromonas marina]|uniref:Uncharacterized protein n=1 Tax=Psychromonas marina TaxID=88364 RepID=A0ABQ6DVC0_9GAMM|nr:hypothetical protein [Psychromonas marina]GLS89007.1 hypothetical protein GCM10007916_00740 [Psychromonas marina]
MAAKGYWNSFQKVKLAVKQVLNGNNAGKVLEATHAGWYLALFGASVSSGIVKQSDLAGYRTGPVFIRKSKHTPPSREAVREMMPALFDLQRTLLFGLYWDILFLFIFILILMVMALWGVSS